MNEAAHRGVRRAAVAGQFYPADSASLAREVAGLLAAADISQVQVKDSESALPKALVVPHAGYVYSGCVAAMAYARCARLRHRVNRVVLLGPSHRVPLRGMAVPQVRGFQTPLGTVPLDLAGCERLVREGIATRSDAPHELDHALEVQLPFLQTQLASFSLLPVAVGECAPARVADMLESVWGGSETLIVVSSDLSHFHPYETAKRIDADTCEAILALDTSISGEQACGCHAINGLMHLARRRTLEVALVDLRNSGDVSGDHQRVVGYGSFALYEY